MKPLTKEGAVHLVQSMLEFAVIYEDSYFDLGPIEAWKDDSIVFTTDAGQRFKVRVEEIPYMAEELKTQESSPD